MKMNRFEKLLVNRPERTQRVARRVGRLLERLEPKAGTSFLDVGCGNGAAALAVGRRFGLAVAGIDVDPEQIRLAAEAGASSQARFEVADATRLPFADASFDVVATHKATHHIPEWERAVAEMVRVLRPGGHLLYQDFVSPAWLARLRRALSGGAIGFPTAEKLGALLAALGLESLYVARSPLFYEAVLRRTS